MAIDNLYAKCAESNIRIKNNYEEFAKESETKKKDKKKT